MSIPQLMVFAGPNGAGKSTLSATMLADGTPIFDGDKEFAKLKQRFDATDSGTLYDAVNGHIFEAWKNEQLLAKSDCAFETNFRSVAVMNTVSQFKRQGYETTLFWFALPEIKDAIERVELRVLSGGHQVSLENIKTNFTEGLKNLKQFFKDFDHVRFYQNIAQANNELEISHYLTLEKGMIIKQTATLPDWLNFTQDTSQKKKLNKGLKL